MRVLCDVHIRFRLDNRLREMGVDASEPVNLGPRIFERLGGSGWLPCPGGKAAISGAPQTHHLLAAEFRGQR